MIENGVLAKWHEDELIWWNKYSGIVAYQWKLNKGFNRLIRHDQEADFTRYLFKEGGKLLDLGCGSGWLSLKFAERGMAVTGVDFSQSQIDSAEKLRVEKGLANIAFERADFLDWDCQAHQNEFDSVFINAFLHHLPPVEVEKVLKNVGIVLKPGGKAYLYEPLKCTAVKTNKCAAGIDWFFSKFLAVMLNRMPKIFDLWADDYKKVVAEGYACQSPHEGPIDKALIENACSSSLAVISVKGWHLYSLGFAMQVMTFKKAFHNIYVPCVLFLYWVDRIILGIFGWEPFSGPERFILCGVKLKKAELVSDDPSVPFRGANQRS